MTVTKKAEEVRQKVSERKISPPKIDKSEIVEKSKKLPQEKEQVGSQETNENDFEDTFVKKSYAAKLEDKEAIKKLIFIDVLLVISIMTSIYIWLFL